MSTDSENNTASPLQQSTGSPLHLNDTEHGSYNPTLAGNECQDNELELLKGDAIGETLYSERFVLNTLLKLNKLNIDLQEDENMERDLCSLWDMTLEEDVVKYLLNHEILDLFPSIIKSTEDKRLTEILVGIMGNMCNVQETRDLLTDKSEVVEILLELTSCMDSLTLEQLMRLLAVVFIKMPEDRTKIWYTLILKSEKFVDNICFILNNAANNCLILQTLEALNAILAKFFVLKLSLASANGISDDVNSNTSFEQLFVRPDIIECTIEAFKTLAKQNCDDQDFFDASEIPGIIYKAKQTFCNIHSILTQYNQLSREAYESSNDEILNCFKDILEPMVEQDNVTTWLQHEQDILETLNDVLKVLPQPVDSTILSCLLKLLYAVDEEQTKKNHTFSQYNGSESDDDEIDHQISYTLVLNSLHYLIFKADSEMLKQYIYECPRIYIEKLLQTFEEPFDSEYVKSCYLKLKTVLDE